MEWVERLAAAVDWEPYDLDIEWERAESRLGTSLPSDFKRFCEVFGRGHFSDYLTVYSSAGGGAVGVVESLEGDWRTIEQHPVVTNNYKPYGLYRPGGTGILSWGVTATACDLAWLVEDGVAPDDWQVLARCDASDWKRHDLTMSEFAYRTLLDESFDSGVAGLVEPSYLPEGE
ncbi:SMI1/KNR4 family protein [Streptomyces sp. URMC 125]|uniref:SMI1/KNR4 family protein n=1 Tax=Streptomyces sp. URMC 125 TaxID=3423419 RepID=UPI003F1B1B07